MALRMSFMLHSVLDDVPWDYRYLSSPLGELDKLIKLCRCAGLQFIKARDYPQADHNCVCLTFDDGYLDNWTILHSFMEARRIPYTVFVNEHFVERSCQVRKPGERRPGYLSVGELIRMHESGLADIQSHSRTHTWYATSAKVIDIFQPAKKAEYPWLLWNSRPLEKHQWLEADYGELTGMPVFENDRSLRARRFVFDPDKLDHFTRRVRTGQLSAEDANKLLQAEYGDIGRRETPSEQEARYEAEIRDNAVFIEGALGYNPSVLCWPGGAYCALSKDIAYRFHSCTTIKRGYGRDARFMHRMSPSNPYGRDKFPWKHFRLTLLLYMFRYAAGSLREAMA